MSWFPKLDSVPLFTHFRRFLYFSMVMLLTTEMKYLAMHNYLFNVCLFHKALDFTRVEMMSSLVYSSIGYLEHG